MRSQLIDKSTAELLGRAALQERVITELAERLDAAHQRIERQESRIQFLEERIASLQRKPELLTEKEAAALLRVHPETLKSWRKEHPSPRIPFILMEGGDIRYRAEAIESYLKSHERGTQPAKAHK